MFGSGALPAASAGSSLASDSTSSEFGLRSAAKRPLQDRVREQQRAHARKACRDGRRPPAQAETPPAADGPRLPQSRARHGAARPGSGHVSARPSILPQSTTQRLARVTVTPTSGYIRNRARRQPGRPASVRSVDGCCPAWLFVARRNRRDRRCNLCLRLVVAPTAAFLAPRSDGGIARYGTCGGRFLASARCRLCRRRGGLRHAGRCFRASGREGEPAAHRGQVPQGSCLARKRLHQIAFETARHRAIKAATPR